MHSRAIILSMVALCALILLVCISTGYSYQQDRRLAETPYYETTSAAILGSVNPDAAIGNPLRGLHTSPQWTNGNFHQYSIPSTLEFHYIGMDNIMTGNNTFSWTVLDNTVVAAASRNNHVIWRVYVDYPGSPLALPQFLVNANVTLVPRSDGGVSPQYDDPTLLLAFRQLITAIGARYDGHKSIAYIQLGLLGKWGEWHTYPESGLISGPTFALVVQWYKDAFNVTKLQTRYIHSTSIQSGMGLHDDSFAETTLGTVSWFFWPGVVRAGQTDFWKTRVMGGETSPNLQNLVFDPAYSLSQYKQDFTLCAETTHATYMLHHAAFITNNFVGVELANAKRAHARLGYNFVVSKVAVTKSMLPPILGPAPITPLFQPILINCGSPNAYVDTSGRVWSSDTYFTGGSSFTRPSTWNISNTLDERIYQSERWGAFNYSIPVPPGSYNVILHLAEISYVNDGSSLVTSTVVAYICLFVLVSCLSCSVTRPPTNEYSTWTLKAPL
jgi:Malectin domain